MTTSTCSESDRSTQYHGGTNFGRTAGGPFIATSYDYDAPIDEFGMQWLLPSLTNLNSHRLPRDICRKVHSVVFTCLSSTPGISGGVYIAGLLRQPKWGHLRNLHRAIKQAEPALVSGDPTIRSIGNYEKVKLLLRISPTWQCDCAKCKKKTSADIHGPVDFSRHMSSSQRMEPVLRSCRTTTLNLL